MKGGTGALLVVAGLFVLYIAVTGRLERIAEVWNATKDAVGGSKTGTAAPTSGSSAGTPAIQALALPALPPLPALASPIYG